MEIRKVIKKTDSKPHEQKKDIPVDVAAKSPVPPQKEEKLTSQNAASPPLPPQKPATRTKSTRNTSLTVDNKEKKTKQNSHNEKVSDKSASKPASQKTKNKTQKSNKQANNPQSSPKNSFSGSKTTSMGGLVNSEAASSGTVDKSSNPSEISPEFLDEDDLEQFLLNLSEEQLDMGLRKNDENKLDLVLPSYDENDLEAKYNSVNTIIVILTVIWIFMFSFGGAVSILGSAVYLNLIHSLLHKFSYLQECKRHWRVINEAEFRLFELIRHKLNQPGNEVTYYIRDPRLVLEGVGKVDIIANTVEGLTFVIVLRTFKSKKNKPTVVYYNSDQKRIQFRRPSGGNTYFLEHRDPSFVQQKVIEHLKENAPDLIRKQIVKIIALGKPTKLLIHENTPIINFGKSKYMKIEDTYYVEENKVFRLILSLLHREREKNSQES